jgi:hypothetical protein
MEIEIKRKGLEVYTPRSIDDIPELEEGLVGQIFNKYRAFMDEYDMIKFNPEESPLLQELGETPSQKELEILLHVTSLVGKKQGGQYFFSKVMQNMYDNGVDSLNLDAQFDMFPYGLRANEGRPAQIILKNKTAAAGSYCSYISMIFEGDAKELVGMGARHSSFRIQGDSGGSIGQQAKFCTFEVQNALANCGDHAEDSTFIFRGNVGPGLAKGAQRCSFEVHGSIAGSVGRYTDACTFKTPNEETLEYLMKYVSVDNRVVFIKDGKEEIVKDYAS